MLSMQIKLSELVLAMKGAEDRVATVEDLSDEELEQLHADCRARAEMAATHLAQRSKRDTKSSEKTADKAEAA
jgi:low affinity Fe/Cu permease